MTIQMPAFTTTKLEEEKPKDKGRPLSIWLNLEEEAQLAKDMELMDIGVDAQAVKTLMEIGRNTIYNQVGADQIKYLVSRKRTRFDGRKR